MISSPLLEPFPFSSKANNTSLHATIRKITDGSMAHNRLRSDINRTPPGSTPFESTLQLCPHGVYQFKVLICNSSCSARNTIVYSKHDWLLDRSVRILAYEKIFSDFAQRFEIVRKIRDRDGTSLVPTGVYRSYNTAGKGPMSGEFMAMVGSGCAAKGALLTKSLLSRPRNK